MSRIFFYGLFMDRSLLVAKGLQPEIVGPAVLADHRIHVGERAMLLRCPSTRAHGIVMELADDEARALYSEPSVREYPPERVRVELSKSGEAVEATCYNLPPASAPVGTNPAYATELSRLAEALRFDPAYVDEIAAFAESRTPIHTDPAGGTVMAEHRIFSTPFAKVYPAYVQKAERKERTKEEVDQIICWLTGYDQAGLEEQIEQQKDFATFFAEAPDLHPNRSLIKGVVCGVRVEEVEDPLMQKIRYLDKLIDELARGKAMEKILRR